MWQGPRWPCGCAPGPAGQRPIALPPLPPHYVMPGSHKLDPPYSHWLRGNPNFTGTFPFPRQPWAFESESRTGGTGLIWEPHRRWPPGCC